MKSAPIVISDSDPDAHGKEDGEGVVSDGDVPSPVTKEPSKYVSYPLASSLANLPCT